MLPEIAPEQWQAALDDTAERMITAAGICEPPVDAFAIATSLGIVVATDNQQLGRARFAHLRSGPAIKRPSIFLRSDPRMEREQWAVAHELGEHAAVEVCAALGLDPHELPTAGRETIANQLANRVLLPGGWFTDDGRRVEWDLRALKDRYATASHELIARRMLDFLPSPIITICDQGNITFRRGSHGRRIPAMTPAERGCWLWAHETGEDYQRDDTSMRIRVWAIHEAGWKREIVRTEPIDADSVDGCEF